MTWKALILAAGLGTRLAPYTDVTPKPMFTLAGKPLLYYWIRRLAKAGCGEIFINTHHLHTQIEAYIATNTWDVLVHTFYEPVLLGTAGAVQNIADHWRETDLMVVNSDIICDCDLTELLQWHRRSQNEVSLLLTDCPQFNMVTTDATDAITGFNAPANPAARTFTGVQVVTAAVLDYIPATGFYHSIDAYKAMLQDDRTMKGLTLAGRWQDLGDARRYREAALTAGARKTFGKIFNDNDDFVTEMLKGDGSDRIWRRLRTPENSMIVADHGLTPPEDFGKINETEAFINIGRHLNAKNLAAAPIYFHDAFAGLVFTEDLGDLNLQAYVLKHCNKQQVIQIYMQIIDNLILFNREGIKGFAREWAWQTASYDRDLIINNECGYFRRRFVEEYLGIGTVALDLQAEFEYLAEKITQHSLWGLMHRDMQSRNIMIKDGKPYYIDYQGARLGPLQYDLASLLYDPYVMLDESTRNLLLNYCYDHEELLGWQDKLEKGFYYCALSRSMQALGAYAFLSRIKGKPWFKTYMTPALQNLYNLLNDAHFRNKFCVLRQVVDQCLIKLPQLT